MGEGFQRPILDVLQIWQLLAQLALVHYQFKEGLPSDILLLHSDNVPLINPTRVKETIDLFTGGVEDLVLTELHPGDVPSVTFLLHQLVDAPQGWLVPGGNHLGAYAEDVYGGIVWHQLIYPVLVEVPTGHNLDMPQTPLVQDFSDPLAQGQQVSTVQPHGQELVAYV